MGLCLRSKQSITTILWMPPAACCQHSAEVSPSIILRELGLHTASSVCQSVLTSLTSSPELSLAWQRHTCSCCLASWWLGSALRRDWVERQCPREGLPHRAVRPSEESPDPFQRKEPTVEPEQAPRMCD